MSVVWLLSDVLATCLPSKIKRDLAVNCIRANGTWSRRRKQIEDRAINKLRRGIRIILLLVAVPTLTMVWLVDREVMPLSIGLDTAIEIAKNPHSSRADFANQEQRFDKWKNHGSLGPSSEPHKRWLWRYWPAVAFFGMLWFGFCWILIQTSYLLQLRNLAHEIKHRQWAYQLYDRARSDEWSDEAQRGSNLKAQHKAQPKTPRGARV